MLARVGNKAGVGAKPERPCGVERVGPLWLPTPIPKRKKLIERAYRLAEGMGIALWCEDEAGPFQTVLDAAPSWHREGRPQRQDHEYLRNGTAKVLTLFHPSNGQVRVQGVEHSTNAVLHPG